MFLEFLSLCTFQTWADEGIVLGSDVLHDEFYVWANEYYFCNRSLFVCLFVLCYSPTLLMQLSLQTHWLQYINLTTFVCLLSVAFPLSSPIPSFPLTHPVPPKNGLAWQWVMLSILKHTLLRISRVVLGGQIHFSQSVHSHV